MGMLYRVDYIVWFEIFVVEGVGGGTGSQLGHVDGGGLKFASVEVYYLECVFCYALENNPRVRNCI